MFFACFFQKSASFCRENEIFKNKKETKHLDQFLTLKGQQLDQFLTLQHIYIYIYIFCGVFIWSKFSLFNSYCLVQACFLTVFVKKHYKHRSFSRFYLKRKVRAKILIVIIWSKLFFGTPTFNPTLDQIMTFKNSHVLPFVAFKNVLKYLFYSVF